MISRTCGFCFYLISVECDVRGKNDMVKLSQPTQKRVVSETTLRLVMKYVPKDSMS